MAVAWGLFGGLVEGLIRLWLQDAGATNFDLRLTGISARLLWVAPLSYAALFAPLGLVLAVAQRLIGRFDWNRLGMIALGTLAWLGALASSGRIAMVSVVVLALGLAVTANRLVPQGPRRREALWRGAVAPFVLVALVVLGVEVGTHRREARATAALPPAAAGAPNVLVVIVDTLRADRLASYGYRRGATPVMTRLAAEGVQFDWALAASSWSLPSHVSMLTGHMPATHGAEIDMYDGRFPAVAQALLGGGYRTAAISANTLVFSIAQGFRPGFLRFDDSFYSRLDGFTRTMLGRRLHKAAASALGWDYIPVKRRAADVTRQAIDWVDHRGQRPFFLVLNYFDVHDPEAHASGASGDAYDDAVADVDAAIGTLVAHLEKEGVLDHTIVAILSDHGESLGQHGFGGHGTSLYIEQLHVPLILRFPPRVAAGIRVATPVSLTSLPNTLLDLAGATAPQPFPGQSLAPTWDDAEARLEWPMPRSELRYRPWQHTLENQDLLRSLFAWPWHYIAHSLAEDELFNLAEDPGETRNLAGHPDYAAQLERFRHELDGFGDQAEPAGGDGAAQRRRYHCGTRFGPGPSSSSPLAMTSMP